MDNNSYIALFDLDGVILDTESDYTRFWNMIGDKYTDYEDFGLKIKGQTLIKILGDHFQDPVLAKEVTDAVYEFEQEMDYAYIPGAEEFLDSLIESGIKTAVVTSSDNQKMSNVYRRHPDFKSRFECILTSEDFTESKPSPQCYQLGMQRLGALPVNTVVFEDSVSGLTAGQSSGAFVVGLSTTNPIDIVSRYSHIVLPDFKGIRFHELVAELELGLNLK